MRTERYILNVRAKLLADNTAEATSLLHSLITDFLALDRKEAEKQFGKKKQSEYWLEFTYSGGYSKLSSDDIIVKTQDDDSFELKLFIPELHISTPSGFAYAIEAMLQKMIDESVTVEYIYPEIQCVLLGPVKQPEYCHDAEWYDEDQEHVQWYHIVPCSINPSYHVGDSLHIDSYRTEVYGACLFYDENELADWLDENYPDIKEI